MDIKKIIIATLMAVLAGFILAGVKPKELPQAEIKTISYERSCLIEALYHEARNTSQKERTAVLEVILNRTRSSQYPNTICEVVHQPWQFSYYNAYQGGDSQIILPEFQNISSNLDKKAYLEIEKLVDNRLAPGATKHNKVLPKNALHYHTKAIKPYWAGNKRKKTVLVDKGFKHKYYANVD